MDIEFLRRFLKDVEKLNDQKVLKDIDDVITNCKNAADHSEIRNIKKISGHTQAYRIRKGQFRIGIYIHNNVIEFARVLHRKDMYKYFP